MAMLGRLARTAASTAQRSFSTSAALQDGLVRPPIQLFGIDGRYAHALFSASSKANALPAVEKDMAKVKGLIESDEAFANFLNTPILSRAVKTAAVQDVMTKLKMNDNTVNFFASLAENNRLPNAGSIIDAFDTLISAHRNEVKCTVTSASPLDKSTLTSLTKSLKGFAAEGQTVQVTSKVDESIVGGLIVEVGDKYIDMSVKSRVNKLMNELKAPI